VEKAVRNGIGEMPVITGLTDAEIKLVARYLAEVAGKK
jgi:mono/diheme cytochrome c family protein